MLRKRLQTAIDTAPALAPSPEFLASLTERLRPVEQSRMMTRRAWLETWLAAAAAGVAAIGGGLFARDAWRRSRLARLAASAAGDHQNCAIKFNLRERPIGLEEAAIRFDPAYRMLSSIEPPPGSTVLDRHSCVFEGRRFGHIVFRYREHVVSLLVTSGGDSTGTVPAIVRIGGSLHVASFDAGAHDVFVVSDMSEADTLSIARAVAEPVRRALERA